MMLHTQAGRAIDYILMVISLSLLIVLILQHESNEELLFAVLYTPKLLKLRSSARG